MDKIDLLILYYIIYNNAQIQILNNESMFYLSIETKPTCCENKEVTTSSPENRRVY